MELKLVWQPYRLYPYERALAREEVERLVHQPPRPTAHGLALDYEQLTPSQFELLRRTTYFAAIRLPDGNEIVPDQARLEATSYRDVTAESKASLGKAQATIRQQTRYSAHGLHEYRGKFNPQVVRAIGNILSLRPGSQVLDPFCGSGTTLLEGLHCQWNTVGLDLNPLASLIANAKIGLFAVEDASLKRQTDRLISQIGQYTQGWSFEDSWDEATCNRFAGVDWRSRLHNVEYLRGWFPNAVLAQFSFLLNHIDDVAIESLSLALKVILSDLARDVSWQESADLRIRRVKQPQPNAALADLFVSAVRKRIGTVLRARSVLPAELPYESSVAFEADARDELTWLPTKLNKDNQRVFEAAITSPPYATALPYIDTQRLSLALLGLTDAKDIMALDRSLIGTREIKPNTRRVLEAELHSPEEQLPKSVYGLCQQMADLAEAPVNGFRRRNMSSLVYQYFRDMGRSLSNIREVLVDGGKFALIVGPNQTTLSSKRIFIDTPALLGDVARHSGGWKIVSLQKLDTYARYGLHYRNSIRAESLLIIERI